MKRFVVGGIVLAVIAIILGVALRKHPAASQRIQTTQPVQQQPTSQPALAPALNTDPIAVGKQLSGDKCTGEGVPYKLSVSPMKPEDFTQVIPYGELAGGHVTPIDHQYFAPADYHSPVDAYEVRAMGDATIVDMETRTNTQLHSTEYRMIFSITCTFMYYYDLVTSLAPDIQAEFDATNQDGHASPNIKVKAGQLIGRIGGRTLDFAVWDGTKTLTGYVNPDDYKGEPWKIHTVDPLNYYTDELKSFILSRYVRTAEPRSGKIDYDVDGKLIGNWFVEGSGGYTPQNGSPPPMDYFKTHLAFVPDQYDPSHFYVSIGALYGKVQQESDMQHMTKTNGPDPATVGVDTGIVRYDLVRWHYLTTAGKKWDQMSYVPGVTASTDGEPVFGCAIVQLVEARKLQFEVFPGKSCSNSVNFTAAATYYTR